jgi:tetratricopeptide (TPR) repeat protein
MDLENEDDDEEAQLDVKNLPENPCLNNFRKFRDVNMKPIDGGMIYKKILNAGYYDQIEISDLIVKYEYDLYIENSKVPFDSNIITKKFGIMDEENSNLPGIVFALMSMRYKEQALFWISHELMYGMLGMCNKIPPKSDIVARLRIAKLFSSDGKEIIPKLKPIEKCLKFAQEARCKGKNLFDKGDFESAAVIFEKAIDSLERAHLNSVDEEMEAKEMLISFYLNICICYNKMQKPKKTCLAMKQLERLSSIASNGRALYAKAKALLMLEDFDLAEKFFKLALKIEPNNKNILAALDEIPKRKKQKRVFKNIVSNTQKIVEQPVNLKLKNDASSDELSLKLGFLKVN